MEYVNFINLSPVQCFDNREQDIYEDILDDKKNNEINDNKTYNYNLDYNYFDQDMDNIEVIDNSISQTLLSEIEVKNETINLLSNISKVPEGNSDTILIKTPVVLAQLIIPINISSSIKLPEKTFEIIDIKTRLILKESTLLQPTNILFLKGFVHKEIEYFPINPTNNNQTWEKTSHTLDIPFKCSTSVNFFTPPLEHIINIKEILQYDEKNSPEFNQINDEFFNENPFCKLLSSKIIGHSKYFDFKDEEYEFTKIDDIMTIKLKIEILQNQPILISPDTNKTITP